MPWRPEPAGCSQRPQRRPEGAAGTATGTVKWFNGEKGYGFIAPDDGSADLFAHYTQIEGRGFRSLEEGQKVRYEVGQGQKGLQAQNFRPLLATGYCAASGPPGSRAGSRPR